MAALGAAIAMGALALGACGGGDAAGAGTTSATSVVPAGAPVIDQKDLAFKPDKLTVKAGEKVYVKNSESAIHTVNIDGKNQSGNMKKGDVFVWTAASAGTYKVTCDYHPQMRATIVVE
jgi:plastocyanin